MNSYILSRQWFDFAFENPDKITVTHGALYMWLIEANNRNGWAEKFPFNTEDACTAIGVHNRKTVWKALNELANMGFVSIVFKSGHRHKPSVISLPVTDHSLKGSLDKALTYQSTERTGTETVSGLVREQYGNSKRTGTETVSGHSNKPLNNETLNKETTSSSGSGEPQKEHPLLILFNELTGRQFRILDSKAERQYKALRKKGFTHDDFTTAITNGYRNSCRWENPALFTPEYITREPKFVQFLEWETKGNEVKPELKYPAGALQYGPMAGMVM